MRTGEAEFLRLMRHLLVAQHGRIMERIEDGKLSLDDGFWAGEEDGMYAAILPIAINTFGDAAARAMQVAFTNKQSGDLAGLIEKVSDRARGLVAELVASLTRTTRQTVGRIMVDYMTATEVARPAIIARLTPLFGQARAEAIATTELTRLQMQGTAESAEELRGHGHNVVLVWVTDNDERVCEICAPRHLTEQGDGWDIPEPAHVNCRCDIIERVR